MSVPTYTHHGSDAFHERFHGMVQAVAKDVENALGENLVALILGGGYGRGEGAIIVVDDEEQPYNDLDFLLVVHRPGDVDQDAMRAIKKRHEALTHLHVDFTQPFTTDDLAKWPPWLMWHDFVNGYITSAGDPDTLEKHVPASVRGTLTPIEASRLLINRGAGLLWAMRIARECEPPEDDDFAKRNYWKAALALGDALLIAYERYATPYQGRDQRFRELARTFTDVAEFDLIDLYQEALHFKFSPHEVTTTFDLEMLGRQWVQVFLHIEERRFKRSWPHIEDYAAWTGLREPEEHVPSKWPRNLVKSLRLRQPSWRYPAEFVYRWLPLALHDTRAPHWNMRSGECLDLWKGVMGIA